MVLRTFLLIFLAAFGLFAGTTVSDTIYMADGTKANGYLTIDFPYACTGPSGKSIAVSNFAVSISDGAFTVDLEPNDTCTTTYYVVTYHLRKGPREAVQRQFWIVPTSAETQGIEDVATGTVSPPSTQFPITQLTACANSGESPVSNGTSFVCSAVTVNPMSAVGDLMYGGTAGAVTRLAPNTLAAKYFLGQTGTGTAGQAPAWSTIGTANISDLSTWAGTTNVTTLKFLSYASSKWTLYDSTASTGVSTFKIRSGAGQNTTDLFAIHNNADAKQAYMNSNFELIAAGFAGNAFAVGLHGSVGLRLASTLHLKWSGDATYYGTPDVGFARDSAGIGRVTDGSTGTGALIATPSFVAGRVAIIGASSQPTSANLASWDASGRVIDSTVAVANLITRSASVALTAQAAAITTTNLLATAPAGTYRVAGYLHTTTASAGACTSGLTIGYTYNSGAKTLTPITGHSHAVDETASQGTVILRNDASANITYAVDLTAGGGDCANAVFALYVTLERLQ